MFLKLMVWVPIIIAAVVAAVGFVIWVRWRPYDVPVAICSVVSIALGVFALRVACVAVAIGNEHREALSQIEGLLSHAFSLEAYIKKAAEIYTKPDTERFVVSLRYWAASPRLARVIEKGIRDCTASELFFVGHIAWNAYLPGVLWRFVTVRDNMRLDQKAMIIHVEEDIPVFVVSKKQSPAGDERGSLLVGIPLRDVRTAVYGLDMGEDYPRQVEHYNFLFDTLIYPQRYEPEVLEAILKVIKISTGRDKAYVHEDGLQTIFRLEDFRSSIETGASLDEIEKAYAHSPALEDIQAYVLTKVARRLAVLLRAEVEEFGGKEEREYLIHPDEILGTCTRFLRALIESKILVCDVDMRTFVLQDPFSWVNLPRCDDLFHKSV